MFSLPESDRPPAGLHGSAAKVHRLDLLAVLPALTPPVQIVLIKLFVVTTIKVQSTRI